MQVVARTPIVLRTFEILGTLGIIWTGVSGPAQRDDLRHFIAGLGGNSVRTRGQGKERSKVWNHLEAFGRITEVGGVLSKSK